MKDSIIVYSSPTCPRCRMLKLELKKNNIEYDECQDTDIMSSKGIKTLPI